MGSVGWRRQAPAGTYRRPPGRNFAGDHRLRDRARCTCAARPSRSGPRRRTMSAAWGHNRRASDAGVAPVGEGFPTGPGPSAVCLSQYVHGHRGFLLVRFPRDPRLRQTIDIQKCARRYQHREPSGERGGGEGAQATRMQGEQGIGAARTKHERQTRCPCWDIEDATG